MPHASLIDVHQHPIPDYYKRALASIGVMGSGENPWAEWSLEQQLELMERNGIAAVIHSVASPGCYFGDVDFAVRVARECNEGAARLLADRPDLGGGAKAAWGLLGLIPLVPFIYVLTGGDLW